MGNSYLLDFIQWELEKERQELEYRSYITDILRASNQWETPPERYAEIYYNNREKKNTQIDTRTAEEIKLSVTQKINAGRASD